MDTEELMGLMQSIFTAEDYVKIYNIYKELTFLNYDRAGEYFLPSLMNGRNAFDHMMRGVGAVFDDRRYGTTFGEREEYIKKTAKSAIKHLQRATYDLIDKISIDAKKNLEFAVEKAGLRTTYNKVPNYNLCKTSISQYGKASEEMRMNKDAEIMTFDQLKNHIYLLKNMLGHVDHCINALAKNKIEPEPLIEKSLTVKPSCVQIEKIINKENIKLYSFYKKVILHYEECHAKTPLKAIVNGAQAYDHLMRIFITPVDDESSSVDDNVKAFEKELKEGIMSILRASLDHCKLDLGELLKGFSKNTIISVNEDYPIKKGKIDELNEEIGLLMTKAIGPISFDTLEKHYREIEKIEKWVDEIGLSAKSMIDLQQETNKKYYLPVGLTMLSIVLGVVGVVYWL